MSRLSRLAVGVIVLVLVVAAVVRFVASNGADQESDKPALEGLVVPSSGAIRWSPDATKIAFVVDGAAVIVRVSDAQRLGRAGRSVVDAGWSPDARRVLVVEGPIPTGEIAAVGVDGEVQGTTKLRTRLSFASGRGVAVNDTTTQAALVTVAREAIGGASVYSLAVVDLQTGEIDELITERDRAVSNPVYVDDTTIAYAAALPGGQVRLHTFDFESRQIQAHGPIHDGPYGVLPSGEVVVGRRAAQGAIRLDAIDPAGGSSVLGVLPPHTRPVAIDRFGTRVLVRRYGGLGGTRLAIEELRK